MHQRHCFDIVDTYAGVATRAKKKARGSRRQADLQISEMEALVKILPWKLGSNVAVAG